MNYLLVGAEPYTLKRRREEIVKETVGSESAISCSLYRGIDKVDMHDVIDDCQMVTLFGDTKLVIYENPMFLANLKGDNSDPDTEDEQLKGKGSEEINLLIQYLQSANPDTTLIIYYEGVLPERNKTIKLLATYLKYERYDQLSQDDFNAAVRRDLAQHHRELDTRCLNELLGRLPLSLENWQQELQKLLLYPGRITPSVIDELISKPLEDNAFELSNAVVDRKLGKAINVFRDLMVNHKNDIPAMIGLLANQFRTMSQVKIMADQQMSQQDIATAIGSRSTYRIQMVLKAINNASRDELLGILNDLSALDQDIKSGRVDQQTGLELFIVKACRR